MCTLPTSISHKSQTSEHGSCSQVAAGRTLLMAAEWWSDSHVSGWMADEDQRFWNHQVRKGSSALFFCIGHDSLFPLLTSAGRSSRVLRWCHFSLLKALLSLLSLLFWVLIPFFSSPPPPAPAPVICFFTFIIVCLSNQSSPPPRCFFLCCDKCDSLSRKRHQWSGHAETVFWSSLSKWSQKLLPSQLNH